MIRHLIDETSRRRRAVPGAAMLAALVVLATIPAPGAMAAPPPGEQARQQGRVAAETDRHGDVTRAQNHLVRASRLIGMEVRNHRDRLLGEVWDVVLSRRDGDIAYLVVAVDRTLGLGEAYVVVPWTRIRSRDGERFAVLDIDGGQVERLPRFDVDGAWPLEAEWPFEQALGSRETVAVLTMERGTEVALQLNELLSSKTARTGNQFTLSVVDDIRVGGRVAIPRGSLVEGEVLEVRDAGRRQRSGMLMLTTRTIRIRGDSMPLDASITADGRKIERESDLADFDRDDLKDIGLGAAIGALLKGDEGALDGLLIGGGVFLAKKGEEVVLPRGTRLLIELEDKLDVRVSGWADR